MSAAFSSRSLRQARKRAPRTKWPKPGSSWKFPKIRSWRSLLLKTVLLGSGLVVLYLTFLWFTLPNISDPRSLLASQSTVITDRDGVELYRLFNEEDRTYIDSNTIPEHMKLAAVAIEDERYFERGCLDVRALARAVLLLGRAGGGSTITRQLARNALDLKRENRYVRKLKEIVLGCQLESKYNKDELLSLYLNWIPFGENAYGIEQASKVYFDSSASGLTLAQSVILASLPQAPTYYSPYGSHRHTTVTDTVYEDIVAGSITDVSEVPSDSIRIGLMGGYIGTGANIVYIGGRSDQVLKNMVDQEFITPEERQAALDELATMEFQPSREDIRAPHFVLWVRDQVLELFAGTAEEGLLEQGGLRIQTSLDWELQQRAEQAVERYREDIETRFGAQNMALVSMDANTNEILAYVGNMDYNDSEHGGKIDMAQAPRQPGSSFKPFVYASMFANGYSPATPLWDVPTKIGNDEPQNFDSQFMGLMTARQALGASRNVPAAKAYFLGGQENEILTTVSALGAPTPLERKNELQIERGTFDYGWPLSLGAAETPLNEMTAAYAALARGGESLPVISIQRITDKQGNLLYAAPAETGEQVIDERVAYQITSILTDESVRPEEYWRTQLTVPGYQTASKTGTSNKCMEWKDIHNTQGEVISRQCLLRKPDNAWLMGYTPNLVTGVWVGNADSSAMFDTAGGLNTASPIWRDYMIAAHRLLPNPKTGFSVPEGVIQPQISTLSGQLPKSCTPVDHRRADVFLEENAPSELDPACAELVVDKVTGLLASDACPQDALESGSFLVARSVLPDRWPTWEEGVQEWVAEQMVLWNSDPSHSGAIIPLPIAPTEYCDPALTPGRLDKPTVEILSPAPNGVATYPAFQPRISIEARSKIQEVNYYINNAKLATATSAPFTQSLRMPRSVSENGRHQLTVEVVDEYFNKAQHTVFFSFEEDERAPEVSFVLPRSDIQLPEGGELTLSADAIDREGGLKHVQFYIDDILLTTKPRAPFELTYELTQAPGVYTLRAVATDFADNTSEDIRTLTIR